MPEETDSGVQKAERLRHISPASSVPSLEREEVVRLERVLKMFVPELSQPVVGSSGFKQ